MDLAIPLRNEVSNPFFRLRAAGNHARVNEVVEWLGARCGQHRSLESAKVVSLVPRYGKMSSKVSGVIGFENLNAR